ncbi:DUF2155 domain-containing protein [Parvibaculaceae bacterium PLY_AMNH_Bact1]|nr:DUF2155 domain-containing protein [Parvibaculaceae bacterium PLY_AMNH_Bact1]
MRSTLSSIRSGILAAAALVASSVAGNAEPVGETAIFTGLDKITARITRLEVQIGERVQFGTLEILANSCNKRPPTETPETTAFVEVFDVGKTLADELAEKDVGEPSLPRPPERLFSGWMFASSPGLNAVEHPVYDVWLIDCKMSAPETSDPIE